MNANATAMTPGSRLHDPPSFRSHVCLRDPSHSFIRESAFVTSRIHSSDYVEVVLSRGNCRVGITERRQQRRIDALIGTTGLRSTVHVVSADYRRARHPSEINIRCCRSHAASG